MQLYALDSLGKKIDAQQAEGGVDYLCFECNGRMRVRISSLGRLHFFHLKQDAKCRHNGKSEEHIFLQELVKKQIGSTCELEKPFPEIGRIADVAWPEYKIVFEVQCSPISVQEVRDRCEDYEKMGWYVIWILLSSTFYRMRLKNVPYYLQSRTHYYASATRGEIFDLIHPAYLANMHGHDRRFVVDLGAIERCQFEKKGLPRFLERRIVRWRYLSKGDLLWQVKEGTLGPTFFAIFKEPKLQIQLLRVVSFVKSAWYLILETALRSRMR